MPTDKEIGPLRTLFVRNVSYETEDETIREIFGEFGDIKTLFSRISSRGMVFVSFYDIRDAINAKQELQERIIKGRAIDVHYSIPKEKTEKGAKASSSQEDSLLFSLPSPALVLSEEALRELLVPYGEIREVKEGPTGAHQKIVQFHDTRCCIPAKEKLDGSALPSNGERITVDFHDNPLPVATLRDPKRSNGPERRPRRPRNDRATPYSRFRGHDDGNMKFRSDPSPGVQNMINGLVNTLQARSDPYPPSYPRNRQRSPYPPEPSYQPYSGTSHGPPTISPNYPVVNQPLPYSNYAPDPRNLPPTSLHHPAAPVYPPSYSPYPSQPPVYPNQPPMPLDPRNRVDPYYRGPPPYQQAPPPMPPHRGISPPSYASQGYRADPQERINQIIRQREDRYDESPRSDPRYRNHSPDNHYNRNGPPRHRRY